MPICASANGKVAGNPDNNSYGVNRSPIVEKVKMSNVEAVSLRHRGALKRIDTAQGISLIRGKIMLYTIAVVLLILWLLGLVSSFTLGGFIHVLLVVAVVMVLLRLISGRRV